ncbi:hypothetical protein ACJX0J_011037 [Zea mays]
MKILNQMNLDIWQHKNSNITYQQLQKLERGAFVENGLPPAKFWQVMVLLSLVNLKKLEMVNSLNWVELCQIDVRSSVAILILAYWSSFEILIRMKGNEAIFCQYPP